MDLKAACSVLLVPPMQCQVGAPPVSLNVDVDVALVEFVPLATSLVINELVEHCSESVLRIFSYNLAVSNNWNSSWLTELVKFTLEFSYYRYTRALHVNIENAIVESVSEAVALLSCELINRYPDIVPEIESKRLHAIKQNLPRLGEIYKEINTMYGRNQYNPNQPQMTQQQMQQGQPQYVYNQQTGQYMPVGPAYNQQPQNVAYVPPSGYQNSPSMMGMQQSQPMQPSMGYQTQPNNFMSNMGHIQHPQSHAPVFDNRPQNPQQSFYGNQGKSMDDDRYSAMSSSTGSKDHSSKHIHTPVATNEVELVPLEPAKVETRAESDMVELTSSGESEMDRARHQLKIFERDSGLNTLEQYEKVLEQANGESKEVYHLHETLISIEGVENAISEVSLQKARKSIEGNDTYIYRAFCQLSDVYISRNDMVGYMENLCNRTGTIAELAQGISNMVKVTETLVDQEDYEVREVLSFLQYLNNYLTRMINGFLAKAIGSTIVIDCFVTDGPHLLEYLESEDSGVEPRLVTHYKELESFILSVVFNKERVLQTASEFFDMYNDPEGEYRTIFVTPLINEVSVTVIDYSYEELGYDLEQTGPALVMQTMTPLLFNLVSTIDPDALVVGVRPNRNFVVTQDKVTMELVYNYKRNAWVVYKYN